MSIDDDYFKKFRDGFFKNIKDIFGLDPFADSEDQTGDDEPIKLIVPSNDEEEERPENPFKPVGFSISYKFGTGMDEPEIRSSGNLPEGDMKKITEKLFEQFRNGPFNSLRTAERKPLSTEDLTPKMILPDGTTIEPGVGPLDDPAIHSQDNLGIIDVIPERDGQDPFADILEDANGNLQITLDVPGVCEENSRVDIEGNKITITCETPKKTYAKEITLRFAPEKHKVQIHANHGIIEVLVPKPNYSASRENINEQA